MTVLVAGALALGTKYGAPSIAAAGPQGFSETLYAYASQANNNGSAFAGYTGYVQPQPGNVGAFGITFADLLGGLAMLCARFAPIVIVLAIAGSLLSKRPRPPASGRCAPTRRRSSALLVAVVVVVGALTFFPALLLGPVVQGLTGRLF